MPQEQPKKYKYTDKSTGLTFSSPTALTGEELDDAFNQLSSQMPDSLKPKPAVQDVTATPAFANVKPQQGRPLSDLFGPLGRLAAQYQSPAGAQSFGQTISDIGSVGEFVAPLIAAPIPNPFLRATLGGGLQGTATALKLAGQGKKPADVLSGAGESALMGTGLGMIGEGIGGTVAGKTIAPFGKQVDQNAIALANRYGIQTPASSVTSSRAVPLIETVAGKSLFTNRLGEMVDAAKSKLNQIVENSVSSFGKSTVPTDVGKSVERGFSAAENTFRSTKDALYSAAQLNKGDVTVVPQNALSQLDEVIADLSNVQGQKPATLAYLKSLRNGLDPQGAAKKEIVDKLSAQGFDQKTINAMLKANPQLLGEIEPGIDAQKVLATIRDMNTKTNFKNPNPIVQGYEGRVRGVASTLSDDLDNAISQQRPDLADAITKANSYYKEGIGNLNSKWGQKINTFIQNGKTSEIAPSLLNRATPSEWIPKIYQTLGEDATKSLQAATLEKIATEARSGSGFLTPMGIDNQIKRYGEEKITAMLGPDKLQLLKDVGKLSEMIGKSQKVTEGSQTALLGRIAAEAATVFVNPLATLKLMMGDYAFSHFISSNAGQKFLTTGIRVSPVVAPAASNAVRVGGQVLPQLLSGEQQIVPNVSNR